MKLNLNRNALSSCLQVGAIAAILSHLLCKYDWATLLDCLWPQLASKDFKSLCMLFPTPSMLPHFWWKKSTQTVRFEDSDSEVSSRNPQLQVRKVAEIQSRKNADAITRWNSFSYGLDLGPRFLVTKSWSDTLGTRIRISKWRKLDGILNNVH